MSARSISRRQAIQAAVFTLASVPFLSAQPARPRGPARRPRGDIIEADILDEETGRLETLLAAHTGSPWVYDWSEVSLGDPLIGRMVSDARSNGGRFPAPAVAEALGDSRVLVLKRVRLAPLIAYGGAVHLPLMPEFDPGPYQQVASSWQNVFLATIPVSFAEAAALPRLPESVARAQLDRLLRVSRPEYQLG